ncbi:hemerythrin domain-containing protein [Actinophytocola gossypii]|uniref:Hemerythrin domain-containing protein n=1 Tax=Actinophytocola gossypii TaxID=2812003 RepID=A0ABT2J9A8_9PSEU|nr:hemerythrin domain-containing protein [Actinophytocola gossypii]MCT2584452.1 hemerythrin domain-containing protein [Actinophytocola gossypii]
MPLAVAPPSIITHQVGQHRAADLLFAQLEKLHDAPVDHAKDLVGQAVVALMKHSVAEETLLYPLVRERVPGGDELADQEIARLDLAEQTMKDLEGLEPTDERFWPLVHDLIAQARRHVYEQEFRLFPLLLRSCPNAELVRRGEAARRSGKLAPTRPHPAAPNEGAALAVLAPGVGLVDRLRDLLSGRNRRPS